MNEEARRKLEYAIATLDEQSKLPEYGSWKSQVENEFNLDDTEALRNAYIYLPIIQAGQESTEQAIGKILIGENILTPSLTTRGWRFWKQPLLTESQRKVVESAFLLWSATKIEQLNSLMKTIENVFDKDDPKSIIFYLASSLDINSACMQHLSASLKKVLTGT
jgi:hypothetical protein